MQDPGWLAGFRYVAVAMRILFTIHHYLNPSSGAPGATVQLAAGLRARGHNVQVCSFGLPRARLPEVLRQVTFPVQASVAAASTQQLDLVDASTADLWPLLVARRAGLGSGPALVTRSHGLEHANVEAHTAELRRRGGRAGIKFRAYRGGVHLKEVELSLRLADAVLLLNAADEAFAVNVLGVRAERIHRITNGLNAAMVGLGPPLIGDEATVVHVIGSFISIRGSQYSVPALTKILQLRPRVRARLLGVGVPAAEVLSHFPQDMRPRVEVVESYANADLPHLIAPGGIVMSASVSEGFGTGLLEAMAVGLAPVASAAPGPREIIEAGVSGSLVPIADANALSAAVLALVDSPVQRHEFATAAHGRAQGYAWEAVIDRQLAIYGGVVEARRSSEIRQG
jgi:glycosyltransferase involved in cell wall biosynthesis